MLKASADFKTLPELGPTSERRHDRGGASSSLTDYFNRLVLSQSDLQAFTPVSDMMETATKGFQSYKKATENVAA